MPPQWQAPPHGNHQAEINRFTNVTAQWSMGEPHRSEYANFYSLRQWSAHHARTPNMSPVAQHYKGQQGYYDHQGWQRCSFNRRQEFHNRQINNQGRFYYHQIMPITHFCQWFWRLFYKAGAGTNVAELNKGVWWKWQGSDHSVAGSYWVSSWKDRYRPPWGRHKQTRETALGNINALCKEGNLTWYKVRQRLIEYYWNVPYALDAMFHILTCHRMRMKQQLNTWLEQRSY